MRDALPARRAGRLSRRARCDRPARAVAAAGARDSGRTLARRPPAARTGRARTAARLATGPPHAAVVCDLAPARVPARPAPPLRESLQDHPGRPSDRVPRRAREQSRLHADPRGRAVVADVVVRALRARRPLSPHGHRPPRHLSRRLSRRLRPRRLRAAGGGDAGAHAAGAGAHGRRLGRCVGPRDHAAPLPPAHDVRDLGAALLRCRREAPRLPAPAGALPGDRPAKPAPCVGSRHPCGARRDHGDPAVGSRRRPPSRAACSRRSRGVTPRRAPMRV